MRDKIGMEVLNDEISWKKDSGDEFVYTRVDKNWKIKMNDFPEEVLYTLFVDGKPVLDFDDWPQHWDKL